ncbi:MAG: histidine kinase [Lachnospiraceae bacterium]|nr:histidine kinase [Lachnospiraceae bacterium]
MSLEYFVLAFEVLSGFICLIIVTTICFAKITLRDHVYKLAGLVSANAFIQFFDAMSLWFREDVSYRGYLAVLISNFLVFLFSLAIAVLGTILVNSIIKERVGSLNSFIVSYELIAAILAMVILGFTKFQKIISFQNQRNIFYRTDYFWIQEYLSIAFSILMFVVLIIYYEYFIPFERFVIVFCSSFMLFSAILQIFVDGDTLTNIATTLYVLFIVIIYQTNSAKILYIREKQLNEEKIILFNRQIHPHFIFNSILVIEELCHDNREAVETIRHFAGFLRKTVESMNESDCISIKEELELVDNYLYLEKKRFGDTIKVSKNILDMDFKVPSFSIQVFVENAIQHGIRAKYPPKGNVTINIYKGDKEHIIEVKDDGIGFDPYILSSDKEVHTGIENVERRLKLMCNGSLEVESAISKGTRITVKIPITP